MSATNNAKPAFEFQLIYMTRTIGFMGLLLNSLGLIIILNKTLIHPIYNFTWGRTFCNWFVCFLGCGWVQSVDFDVPGSYYQRAYSVYVIGIPSRIALFASSISDVMLILNRYFVITEKRVWLLNISKLTNLIICYAFSVCLFLSVYFAVRLEAVNSDEEFSFKLTDFGQSTLFRGFAAGTLLLETVLGVFALGFLNLLSAIRFREKMDRKANLLQNRTETKRAEEMYSKMVLILTTICFITRLTDAIARIFIRFANMSLDIYKVSDETKTRISLCYDISFMFLLAAHAFDNWVYFLMDPNLRRCTRMLFCRKTTQTTITTLPVAMLSPRPKKGGKRVVDPDKLIQSRPSSMIVREMLLSEMNDRINAKVSCKETTDPGNSIGLYEYRPTQPQPETENLDAIVSMETQI